MTFVPQACLLSKTTTSQQMAYTNHTNDRHQFTNQHVFSILTIQILTIIYNDLDIAILTNIISSAPTKVGQKQPPDNQCCI